jgi:hypothetical protein
MPHTIRLRDPWKVERLAGGRLRYTRRFHQPTGLDACSRLVLVVELPAGVSVVLNGSPLAPEAPAAGPGPGNEARESRYDVAALLGVRNLLALEVAASAGDTQELERQLSPSLAEGAVRLEIG